MFHCVDYYRGGIHCSSYWHGKMNIPTVSSHASERLPQWLIRGSIIVKKVTNYWINNYWVNDCWINNYIRQICIGPLNE